MMDRPDPFFGYSAVLWTILFAGIPAFAAWQVVRLRRALHVFQLEGYKRRRFLEWCGADPRRALFLRGGTAKKPLVMTGRAWRILVTAAGLSVGAILSASAAAHLLWGAPADLVVWGATTVAVWLGAPLLLVAGDWALSPIQRAINARYIRAAHRKLDDVAPVVIGVTGSFGKTSTKFAIERVVGPPGSVLATPESYNTPLGVCRTINERLEDAHRFLVVEMGAYRRGDIAELCRFVRPTIAVLTAIGPAHLERFGSMEAIRAAKYEIVEGVRDDGVAVMNSDDQEVRALADATRRVRVLRYGVDGAGRPDVTARDVRTTTEGTDLTIVDQDADHALAVRIGLLGRHAVGHVLAAVCVAKAVGRSLSDLGGAIESLAPVEHRLQVVRGAGGVTVIDDAFNANPEGASAALEVLDEMPGNHKIVVTPGIIELGPLQFEHNRRFGEHASRVADTLIVVAKTNRDAIVSGAGDGRADVIAVDSLAAAQRKLKTLVRPGDVVLFENDLPDQYEG